MENSRIEELKADFQEVETLLASAKREGVQRRLKGILEELKQAVAKAEHEQPKKVVEKAPDTRAPAFQSIQSFSFEQTTNEVKVYFMSLEGVDGLPAGAVTCDFTPNSFDLKILGLGGKNLRFVQRPLCKTIDPAKSKFKLRSSRVTLYLAKKESGHWDGLAPTKSFLPEKKDEEVKEDPQAALMTMMKDMYQNGDDNMKKMIAESWTKAQEKKGGAPDI